MGFVSTARVRMTTHGLRREHAAAAVFAVALAIEIALFGLPLTPERFLLIPLAAALVLRRGRAYVRDFLPFFLLLLLYEELRGIAHLLNPHPYYRPQIWLEQQLFDGHLPTVQLQHWLWTGHLRFYDHLIIDFSSLHFLVPPGLAFYLWLRDRAFFRRFVRAYLALSFAGALGFLLLPSAPPWAASRAGVISPVALISTDGAGGSTSQGTGLLLHNPYAAIPSLHMGYALLVFIFFAASVRRSRLRWPLTLLAGLYPLLMGFCVVYTGNHYVVDLLIGMVFALVAFVGVPARGHLPALPVIRPRAVAALATALVALGLATALAAAATGERLRVNAADSLSMSLAAARPGALVDLARLLPFSWSRVYVFPGDVRPEDIDLALGFTWPDAPRETTSPAPRPAALLVFVHSGTRRREVVREIRYEGADVGMDCVTGHSYARADARFRIASTIVDPFPTVREALVPASARVAPPVCVSAALPGAP